MFSNKKSTGRPRTAVVPSPNLDHHLSYSWSMAYKTGELIDASTGRPCTG